jgi:putative spermidine/putrescine transport system permease protein
LADPAVAAAGDRAEAAQAGEAERALIGGPRVGLLGWQKATRWAPLAPFGLWMGLFLGAPLAAVCVGAFQRSGSGRFTLANIGAATSGTYLLGFENSLKLSLIEAVFPAIFGALVAYAVHTSRGAVLRRVVVTTSGVFSQFGGVPLAFLFIAAIGSQTALASNWLRDIGVHLYGNGVTIYNFWGVAIVYLYFQVPLMVLVILPAFEGLRSSWREAAGSLGAAPWQYWRYVGVPVLMPSLLGSALLLFGFSLSAYATAQALTSGTIALTSVQIGTFLNGNVLAGQQNVGKALALGLVVVIALTMGLYVLLQKRASRWLQ